MYLLLKPENWLLPLTLLSYTGATTTFLQPILGSNARWLFTVLLFVLLFSRFNMRGLLSTRFSHIVFINLAWAALTIIWSEVPVLSAMKVIAYCLVAVTFFYASYLWVMQSHVTRTIDFLWASTVTTFIAAIGGLASPAGNVNTGASVLYQGLVAGPNMMASLLMMCTPLLVWRCYINWDKMSLRIFWLSCIGIEFIFLLKANSRAALVASILCCISIVYSLGVRKWVPIVTSLLLLVPTLLLISPVIYELAVEKYVFKNASEKQGVLYTRATVWEESYRLAKLGGWTGGGYGVTIGDDSFQAGLTSVGYGREKGNSQMAIVEEMGLVGLGFYILMFVTLYAYQLKMFFLSKNIELRVLLGISMGIITGMVFQSIFEAWWVAPGSPEFVYFWTLIGFSIGVCQLIRQDMMKQFKMNAHKAQKERELKHA